MAKNSRAKGKRGELLARDYLRKLGFEARRGQQYAGGPGSPDLVTNLDCHIEVKCGSRNYVYFGRMLDNHCAQAERESGGKEWYVLWKNDRGPWLLTWYGKDVVQVTTSGDKRIRLMLEQHKQRLVVEVTEQIEEQDDGE